MVVTKLDRAFRSVKHCYDDLAWLDQHNKGFIAITQPIDTTSPTGRLLLNILSAVAEFERDLIWERVKAGMDRARSEGKRIGRPLGKKDKKPRRKGGYYIRWNDKPSK